MIEFTCSSCGRRLIAPHSKASVTTRCPHCSGSALVPDAGADHDQSAKTRYWIKLGSSVTGPISRAKLEELCDSRRIPGRALIALSPEGPWNPLNQPRSSKGEHGEGTSGVQTPQKTAMPVVNQFELEKSRLGQYKVSYTCPHCKERLRSSERELRRNEHCPICCGPFRIAENALEEIQSRRQEAITKKEKKKREKERRAASRRAADRVTAEKRKSGRAAAQMQQVQEPQNLSVNPARDGSIDRPKQSVLVIVGIVTAILVVVILTGAIYFDSINNLVSNIAGDGVGDALRKTGRHLGLNQAERKQLEADIERIESATRTSELLANTVFQQQVSRVDACIEMTGVVAKAFGASSSEVTDVTDLMRSRDILADTVFQQLAGRLRAHFDMLALACDQAGASSADIDLIESSLKLSDSLADTVQQQIAARISGVMRMAELLARRLGSSPSALSRIASLTSSNDSLSKTVFQQMAARQAGVVRMLGAAAQAAGADPLAVSAIESGIDTDDMLVDTVQQQFAARIKRTFEVTAELGRAIVIK